MSAPRAVGLRTPYAAVPAEVRGWVETTLGSPVVAVDDWVCGFSPGCATPVRRADGTRAFALPTWGTPADLARLTAPPYDAWPDDAARLALADRVVAEHSFDARARTLLDAALTHRAARS